MERNYTRAGGWPPRMIFCLLSVGQVYALACVVGYLWVDAKSMTVPQPAATRRRAKTLAAGGILAMLQRDDWQG